jgi:hypothetical protein
MTHDPHDPDAPDTANALAVVDRPAVRRRLRNRRLCENLEFTHAGFRYVASIGRFDDGQIAEVFLSGPKTGTDVASAARDSSIICSIALQYGVPPEVLRHAIGRNSDGTAAGPLGKLLDLLAREDGR